MGAINPTGNVSIEPFSEYPLVFSENLAEFSSRNSRGVIDTCGRFIVGPRYRSVSYFSGGLACVNAGGKYGYIDSFGTEVIPPQFEDARGFSEELAAVKVDGLWGYISQTGSFAITPQFDCWQAMAGPFREGLARVSYAGKWGHITKLGEFRFDKAYEFHEGRAVVFLNKRAGYVDREGTIAISLEYRQADPFSEGVAAVVSEDSKLIEFINRSGESVIPPRYLRTGAFMNGCCLVETEKEIAYIKTNGECVWSGPWVEVGLNPLHLYPQER